MLDQVGRRSRGPRLREIRRQTEVPQDPFHRAGMFNEREGPQPPGTTGALQDVVERQRENSRLLQHRVVGGAPRRRALP